MFTDPSIPDLRTGCVQVNPCADRHIQLCSLLLRRRVPCAQWGGKLHSARGLCRPAALGGHQRPQVRRLALVAGLLLLLLLLLWGSLSACCSGWLSTSSGTSAGLGCWVVAVVAVVVVGFSVGLLLWVVINVLRYVGWPWVVGGCCCCCCCCGVFCRPAALGGYQRPQVRQLALVAELLLLLLLGSLSACCSGWLSTSPGTSAGLGC